MAARKKIYLYIALAIPFCALLIICLSLSINKVKLQPASNFIYAIDTSPTTNSFNCMRILALQLSNNPRLKKPPAVTAHCDPIQLMLYNTQTDSSTSITLEQAKNLSLNPLFSPQSPDLFSVSRYCSAGTVLSGFFNEKSVYETCITHGNYMKKINIFPVSSNKRYEYLFIAWTKNPNNSGAAAESK